METITVTLSVPKGRTTICYRTGCNHFWLCLKHLPKGNDDIGMKNCKGFISDPEKADIKEFNIDKHEK